MPDSGERRDVLLFLVNRLGYGLRADDYASVMHQGVEGWLDEQLAPPAGDDPETEARLKKVTLHIKYDAAENKWPAVDEMRPLVSLRTPLDELWGMFDPQKQINGQEKGRPRLDVIAATMVRSVYSRYQVREIMAQFWHDHFHVNAFSDDHISLAMPTYDQEVIRKHSLGNFREMLEAVASSTAMQYYLSNHSSRAGAANENYARELFELHTLGRDAYLNDHYDRWREVPGALNGHPEGYIDQDVYEAARAFTGWTIEDGGQIDGGRKLPATGHFAYVENWHDGYQKRILATEFDPFGKPMADGRKVLDLVAEHPATARHMAAKICLRLVGPDAPSSLTSQVAALWQKLTQAPDQIAQVVRFIARSEEFRQSRGSKIKRPITLMANYVRLMGYDFTPSEGLFNQLSNAGQRLFGASMPVGLPDDNKIFIGSNAMRNRWQLMIGLAQNAWGNGVPQPSKTLASWGGKVDNGEEIVGELFRLFGVPLHEGMIAQAATASGLVPFVAPTGDDGEKHMALASALAAMAPEFQLS